jgi:hypothetical protein
VDFFWAYLSKNSIGASHVKAPSLLNTWVENLSKAYHWSFSEHPNTSCNPIFSNESPKMLLQNVVYYYFTGTDSKWAPSNDCIHLD